MQNTRTQKRICAADPEILGSVGSARVSYPASTFRVRNKPTRLKCVRICPPFEWMNWSINGFFKQLKYICTLTYYFGTIEAQLHCYILSFIIFYNSLFNICLHIHKYRVIYYFSYFIYFENHVTLKRNKVPSENLSLQFRSVLMFFPYERKEPQRCAIAMKIS